MGVAGSPDRVLSGLLRLLPVELRERHGREIAQVFSAEWREARNRTERLRIWSRTVIGLVTTAAPGRAAILRQDVGYALRQLHRSPSFAIPAILTLAISLGATTAMLGLVNAIVFRPLPFADADRYVYVNELSQARSGTPVRLRMLGTNFEKVRGRPDLFDGVAAHRRQDLTVIGQAGAELTTVALVSQGWSSLALASPVLGRLFIPAEEAGGLDSAVAVVSRRVWSEQLGGSPSLSGASLTIDDRRYRVVGVLPDTFHFPYVAEIWLPARFPAQAEDLLVIARRRGELSVERINEALAASAPQFATHGRAGLRARSLRESVVNGGDRLPWLLLGAGALLLVIACANIAHLLAMRFTSRQREFAIRSALGANHRRQLRQCVTETSVLFALAAAGGLVLAIWFAGALTEMVPPVLRTQLTGDTVPVDWRVTACTALMVLVVGKGFGSVAVRHAAPANVRAALNDHVVAAAAHRVPRLPPAAAAAQIALAIILGSCAVFVGSSVVRFVRTDFGFTTRNVLTVQLDLSPARFTPADVRSRLQGHVLNAVGEIPGVASAALSIVNPVCCYEWGESAVIEGSSSSHAIAYHRAVSPEFFETLQVPIARGRAFTSEDVAAAARVVVVDRRVAETYWPGADPIGRRLRFSDDAPDAWTTVIGIAPQVHDGGRFAGAWYVPLSERASHSSDRRLHLIVRTTADAWRVAPAVRDAISAVDAGLGAGRFRTLEELKADQIGRDRFAAMLLASFAAFGLLLAAIGIYGVSAHGVQTRLPELGMRLVLGASRWSVLGLALRGPLRLTIIGCTAGGLGAALVGTALERTIFNTTTASPAAIALALLSAGCVSALASGVPAARIVVVSPLEAIRRRA